MNTRATRRHFVGATALVGAGAALLGDGWAVPGSRAMRFQEDAATLGEATPPLWRFVVVAVHDPYAGELLRPVEREADMRYVGAEVEVQNESDAPLNFTPGGIRLRDATGVQYLSGDVIGSDPRILDINMVPGERSRGWVWFAVPAASQITELVYVPPAPRLVVAVAQGAGAVDGATPAAGAGTG